MSENIVRGEQRNPQEYFLAKFGLNVDRIAFPEDGIVSLKELCELELLDTQDVTFNFLTNKINYVGDVSLTPEMEAKITRMRNEVTAWIQQQKSIGVRTQGDKKIKRVVQEYTSCRMVDIEL